MEICFVLDASGSVGSHFTNERNFVSDIVNKVNVGNQNLTFGAVTYATDARTAIGFHEFTSKPALLAAIQK